VLSRLILLVLIIVFTIIELFVSSHFFRFSFHSLFLFSPVWQLVQFMTQTPEPLMQPDVNEWTKSKDECCVLA
jgi:predicted ABC-type exoprotein transport system permease subunit